MYCPKCGRDFMDQDWDDYEVHECAEKPEQPKLTNADRIRAMSDEELEKFLFDVMDWQVAYPYPDKWLKQEVDNED